MKTMHFAEAEVALPTDFEAVSVYARDGVDALVGGAIDYPHHWADVAVATTSAITLTLSAGSLFVGPVVYTNDGPTVVDLQAVLPLVAGDRRFVALLLRGIEETITANRAIETDADTGATVQMAVPKTGVRRWEVVIQTGLSSPTPIRPTVAATECCLCLVELASTGIVAVEMDHGSRVKSLAEVDGRVTIVEGDVRATTRRVSTIETDIANLGARLGDIPSPLIIRQHSRDLAMLRRTVAMPAEARAYWYDAGLMQDAWDRGHVSWLARVREGVRFGWAAERDHQLALLDPASASVRMSGSLLMPAWTETARITIDGDGGSTNISQLTHTVTSMVRRDIARRVIEYGPTVRACSNAAEWSTALGHAVGELFTRNGETFEVTGLGDYGDGIVGHVWRTVRQIIVREVTEPYWSYVTETVGVNGSIYGQTWLCSQPGVVTSIDLRFSRVGATGDVHLALCECAESGQPQLDHVIAWTTIPQADLRLGWTKASLRPSLVESGRHYAWFTVTTGNHALETCTGNKYAQGSRFTCTDGIWAQASTDVDFAMRVNFAEFAATRTVVDFAPLTLEDGMTEVRLLTGGWAPGGTSLVWEIRPSGGDVWQPLTLSAAERSDALVGLPPLIQLRAVFLGTTNLQPALVIDATARGMTFRPRPDMVAISKAQDFGLASHTVQMEIVVDAFDPAKHTITPKLVVGAAVLTPAAVSVTGDLSSAAKRTILATFALGAPTTAARARVDMTTTEVTDVPFVQNIALYAL